MKPLENLLVVDLSQFLSGPSASLRLADLGARVIKVERPGTGDICRHLYVSDIDIDGESTIFHAINRNKEGYVADLKDPKDLAKIRKLIDRADVVLHNFRPGVIDRLQLDYATVKKTNPGIVYAEISGYGKQGPWREKAGQDLLAQSLSGMTWLSGNAEDGPVPVGVAIADIWAGALLVTGILACLVRLSIGLNGRDQGGLVEVNMLEAMLDYQFEPLTVYLQDGELPQRTKTNNAHTLLGAPYGVYATADGYLSLAMGSIPRLGELLECPPLGEYIDPHSWFDQRDAIKQILVDHLKTRPTAEWLSILEPADIWCAEVLDWNQMMGKPGFQVLDMTQQVVRGNGTRYATTRCPIRIDGQRLTASRGSCDLGEHNTVLDQEFSL
ncbi:CaiB/BaiF CoA transferase family protein [Novipirellula artificiosorum]|uniref:Formyl-coenzyme A transferase n=1 Tax=Novipirellula artificiosorum TaxID=2528016 RepID=A0A5C6E5P0_9BACT|nr:CaiB/BaiF CoA-transferase family protein [Novipirellula artificiosorum]TWU42786.1 Formyl-coenzyme A transferase [Novipirellula artificiosorum]